jgi:hypothetical protein
MSMCRDMLALEPYCIVHFAGSNVSTAPASTSEMKIHVLFAASLEQHNLRDSVFVLFCCSDLQVLQQREHV